MLEKLVHSSWGEHGSLRFEADPKQDHDSDQGTHMASQFMRRIFARLLGVYLEVSYRLNQGCQRMHMMRIAPVGILESLCRSNSFLSDRERENST